MTRVRLSSQADRDLADIFLYTIFLYTIETFGLRQAERYLADLHAAFDSIADHPMIGRQIDGAPTARRLIRQSHVIFYDAGEEGILILAVKHGHSRDADRP